MGTWDNFPMPLGNYCTRSGKFIKELYDRFEEIKTLNTVDVVPYNPNRYATGWQFYVTQRGNTTVNSVKYLREKIELGLATWWFWNEGDRPYFVHAVKADVLNEVIGQDDWTNGNFIQLGNNPIPLLDEMYLVIDWIAKNIYVRRRTYGAGGSATHASWNGDYGFIGAQSPWHDARAAYTEQVRAMCDTPPNTYSWGGNYIVRPYALTVLTRRTSDWQNAFTFTGEFTTAIVYNVSHRIREDLWQTPLKDTDEIKMWWSEASSWTHFLGDRPPFPSPSPFNASNLGQINSPIKIGGVLQGEVHPGESGKWQQQLLEVEVTDFDFDAGTILLYDLDAAGLKAQLFVPPDRTEDVDNWSYPVGYLLNENIENDTVIYKCLSAHTSAILNEPGVGVDWETYWIPEPASGWYRGDNPVPVDTQSEYGWAMGQLEGFMIRPIFDWI